MMQSQEAGYEVCGRRCEVSAWDVKILVPMIYLPGTATNLKMRFEILQTRVNLKNLEYQEASSPCTEE